VATADFTEARDIYRGSDHPMVSYPLVRLGQVHRERGDLTRARAAYEEALFHADSAGDAQGIVPALAGLARVVADDADHAQRLIARALAYGSGASQVEALLAAGWAALAAGEPAAADWAAQAAALARTRRCRAGLADALELDVLASGPAGVVTRLCEPTRSVAAARLREAGQLWEAIGNEYRQVVNVLLVARLTGGPTGPVERRLGAFGVRLDVRHAAGPLYHVAGRPPLMEIRTLGGPLGRVS
jgi:tetratricopeptide (TPR) repeat protein